MIGLDHYKTCWISGDKVLKTSPKIPNISDRVGKDTG